MEKLAELVGRNLAWGQPSALEREYELRADGEVAATLSFRSPWGSFATGRSGDGGWAFKRMGFWITRATIRECDSEADIGTFRNNTWKNGGTLQLPGERRLLASTNFWRTNLEFQEESGTPLVRLRSRGLVHMSADVELLPRALEIPEMRWIILFGCYLTVMMRMDAAADVAAGAAASG